GARRVRRPARLAEPAHEALAHEGPQPLRRHLRVAARLEPGGQHVHHAVRGHGHVEEGVLRVRRADHLGRRRVGRLGGEHDVRSAPHDGLQLRGVVALCRVEVGVLDA
ncbi:MAG: hypothetical protein ACK559_37565, partial [bacterium]